MSLIVQKFGGTSVGSIERIRQVAKQIAFDVKKGHQLVVVVSAMGKATDALVEMAEQLTPNPSDREMDMLLSTGEQMTIALLAIALAQLQIEAVSMTGWQARIITEPVHRNARVVDIKTEPVRDLLTQGKVVIVAGFQGISENGEITTLGRGGSDTTAAALAARLGAKRCDIFTDVTGVYTADPRIVPNAVRMPYVSYIEMLELARLGAEVLHPRAVEWAKQYEVALTVKSSFEYGDGTWIGPGRKNAQGYAIVGVTSQPWGSNLVGVSVIGAGMTFNKKLVAKMSHHLLSAAIEIREMSSTDLSVTFIVQQTDHQSAVQCLHNLWFADSSLLVRSYL